MTPYTRAQVLACQSTLANLLPTMPPGFTVYSLMDAWPMDEYKPCREWFYQRMLELEKAGRVKQIDRRGWRTAARYRCVRQRPFYHTPFQCAWEQFKMNEGIWAV